MEHHNKMIKTGFDYFIVAIVALPSLFVMASDPSPLQDFCVAVEDPKAALFVNGKFCKNRNNATAEDFFFSGLQHAANTSNPLGANITQVNVLKIPGLNTLGISLIRIDFAPYGLNPPHLHPRASEILLVLEGTLYVGFVTSNPNNTLFSKILNKGDVFVFPQSLIHFQLNLRNTSAVAVASLSSQYPGVITIGNAVFGSKPPILVDVLTKAFHVDKSLINYLQGQYWWDVSNSS